MTASFKAHCAFGFWKGRLLVGNDGKKANMGMGQRLGRITSIEDLPSEKQLNAYLKQAMKLNEPGVKAPSRPVKRKKIEVLKTPPVLMSALRANKKALAIFEAFTPGKKKDYITWIVDAKTEETRERRIEQAVEWISEGKIRNWKYQK